MHAHSCECADANCAVDHGFQDCLNEGSSLLYRIDMDDQTGTLFCNECGEDAADSGLFTDSLDDFYDVEEA